MSRSVLLAGAALGGALFPVALQSRVISGTQSRVISVTS